MAARKKKGRKKVSKKVGKKRHKKASTVHKSSLANELGLLHKIDKKITRIDHTVNKGKYLAHKAKKAKRRAEIEADWESVAQHGME